MVESVLVVLMGGITGLQGWILLTTNQLRVEVALLNHRLTTIEGLNKRKTKR